MTTLVLYFLFLPCGPLDDSGPDNVQRDEKTDPAKSLGIERTSLNLWPSLLFRTIKAGHRPTRSRVSTHRTSTIIPVIQCKHEINTMKPRRLRRSTRRKPDRFRIEHLEPRTLLSTSPEFHFDFGTATSPVADGHVAVTADHTYEPDRSYGWLSDQSGRIGERDRSEGSPLNRDLVFTSEAVFAVDLPNGTYNISPLIGDAAFDHDEMGIFIEGEHVDEFTLRNGNFANPNYHVGVSDGQLTLRLADLGGHDGNVVLNALAITPAEDIEDESPSPESEFDFDFGTATSPVADGHVAVTADHTYKPDRGYGWLSDQSSRIVERDRSEGSPLDRDLVFTSEAVFAVDLPNGAYNISPLIGDAAFDHDEMGIFIESEYVDTFTLRSGNFANPNYHVGVSDGQLTLRLADHGGSDGNAVINALSITPAEDVEIWGHRSGSEGTPLTLEAVTGAMAAPVTFAWDLDGDNSFEMPGSTVEHAFSDDGEYTVSVRATGADGESKVATTTVSISNTTPVVTAGGPYAGASGLPITFSGSATDPGLDDMDAGLTYTWHFGDGTPEMSGVGLKSPSHVYESPGTYTVMLTVVDKDGAVDHAEATISVQAISELDNWESQMLEFGREHADRLMEIENSDDPRQALGLTYYDATRVFYQIADYTGDSYWEEAAEAAARVYRDTYVLPNDGGVAGFWRFTGGLTEHHKRTGDEQSREAVLMLSTTGHASDRVITQTDWLDNTNRSREAAYALLAHLDAETLGAEHREATDVLANKVLGHIDQWLAFGTEDPDAAPYVRPFMVGLTTEALIRWHEETNDPRVLPAVREALDWLWEHTWVEEAGAFQYTNIDTTSVSEGGTYPDDAPGANTGTDAPRADLNLLIAPAYAWVYQETGDQTYKARADQAFAGGVQEAWLGGAKQFNQNYRWSFDAVQWLSEE